jgi:hypothetical protein
MSTKIVLHLNVEQALEAVEGMEGMDDTWGWLSTLKAFLKKYPILKKKDPTNRAARYTPVGGPYIYQLDVDVQRFEVELTHDALLDEAWLVCSMQPKIPKSRKSATQDLSLDCLQVESKDPWLF